MAYTQETVAQELYRCYHCGLASADSSFKYFDNKKADQPRYKCNYCHKFFTLGSHGRPQGRTYAKKRNEDPDELKSLSRQCRHCGVADNALFKYYNNKNFSQPRFKCLSCGKQFQMRLLGTGEERRLVHTSFAVQTRAPRRQKQGVPEPFPDASNGFEDGSYQTYDGSFMPVPSDQQTYLEPASSWFAETVIGEDVQYSNFRDAELAKPEENYEANFTSWTGNGGNPEPSPLNGEDAEFVDFLETELLAKEKNEGSNDDALSSTTNVIDGLPQTRNNEDTFTYTANVADAVPQTWSNEDTFSSTTNAVDGLPQTWSNEDTFSSTTNVADALPQTWSNEVAFSYTANVTDGLPQTWSNEDVFSYTTNVADALPQTWSNEDAKLMNFTGSGVRYNEAPYAVMVSDNMAEMVSESTSNNAELMYGTLALENPVASGHEPWTWTQNNTSANPDSVSYEDDAAAFCRQMDLEMPIENSMEQIDTSVDQYKMNYAEAAAACCRQMDLEMPIENSMEQIDESVDPYKMNYAEAAAACCRQMDLEMPIENSMEQIDTSVDPYKMNYAEAAAACCRQMDSEMARMRNSKADSTIVFDGQYFPDSPWNEGAMKTAPWTF